MNINGVEYVSIQWLKFFAVDLLSEQDENPEYDRALSELIAGADPADGLPLDIRAAQVLNELRFVRDSRKA